MGNNIAFVTLFVLMISLLNILSITIPLNFPLFDILKSAYALYFYTVLSYNILHYWEKNTKNY